MKKTKELPVKTVWSVLFLSTLVSGAPMGALAQDTISSDAQVLRNGNTSTADEREKPSRPSAPAENMNIGVHFGPSFSNTSFETNTGTDIGDTSARTLLSGGIYAEFPLMPFLSWQPELNLIQRGYQVGDEDVLGSTKIGLSYVEVPVFLKGSFQIFDTTLAMLAGPSIGYITGGTQSVRSMNLQRGLFDRTDELNLDTYNRFSFGFNLGASVGWHLTSSVMLTGGLRYYWGMTNVQKADANATVASSKMRAGQLLFGVQVAL